MVGPNRIIHASDFPYVSIEESISSTAKLIELSSLSSDLEEDVFWHNSKFIFRSLTN